MFLCCAMVKTQGNDTISYTLINGILSDKQDLSFIKDVEKSFREWYRNFFPYSSYDTADIESIYMYVDTLPISLGIDDYVIQRRFDKINKSGIIQMSYNSVTKQYLWFYLVKRKNFSERLITLSRYFFPIIEQYLDKYDLPLELKYLVVIESAFNPFARSRAGAVGPWQFIYSTARIYGLTITSLIDERRDLLKSTEAACQYLKFLYETFGDWNLAIAAYNCGPMNVMKAIRYAGSKNFWDIWRYLPAETRGYVPAFYAVRYMFNYYKEHGLNPPPLRYPDLIYPQIDTVMVDFPFYLSKMADILDIDTTAMVFLNPMFRTDYVPASSSSPLPLIIPIEKVGFFISRRDSIKIFFDSLFAQKSAKEKEIMERFERPVVVYHKVTKNESLRSIARKYGCSVQDIMAWNNLKRAVIHPGQTLKIVRYVQRSPAFSVSGLVAESNPVPRYFMHVVKDGETLESIAHLYNIGLDTLMSLNKINDITQIKPGDKIIIKIEKEENNGSNR